jgi:tetratricopeptide (TPR) repeat protein
LVEKDFKELVARLFPGGWSSELEKERREQRSYVKKLTMAYEPRIMLEKAIDDFVSSKEKALVITGESGMGKSALLANWIQKKEKEGRTGILYHFTGVSRSEGNYRKIRQRLINEIRKIYGFITDLNLLNTSTPDKELSADEKQKNKLQDYLFLIPKNESLVIILDGIDKLTGRDNAKLLNWLPAYPDNVKFIFSTPEDDPVMDVFKRLEYPVMAIPPLDIESRKRLITDYLLFFGKKLAPSQRDRIVNDEEHANLPVFVNPLVLRALLDELRSFGVFEELDKEIEKYVAAQDIPEFYIKVLERLENIFDYADTEASNLAADTLALLYVSRNGLSETEIRSLTGAKPVYWSQIYNALGSNLRVCGGLLNFSHNYIREAIKRRYFSGNENENSYRLWLIHYCKTSPDVLKKRIYDELPYQLYNLGDMDGLYHFLMNPDVLGYWIKKDIFEFGKYWRALREVDKNKYSIEKYLELNAKNRDKTELADMYYFLSNFILILGDDNASVLKFSQQELAIREEVHGKNHADTAASYNNMGMSCFTTGNYSKALGYYQQALNILEETHGDKHPDIASSYNFIGMLYSKMGDYPKALEYHLQALDIREELFGGKSAETATSYGNIGQVYHSMGDYPKALEHYLQALNIQEELFGKKDAETVTSYNNIGLLYHSMDDYPKALTYTQQALDIREELFGKKHASTALSYNNIGLIYNSMGNTSRALECYQEALNIQEIIYKEKHPDTATSYNNIGLIYHSMGDYPKALTYIQQALDMQEELFGKKHISTALSYNNIGLIYNSMGNTSRALECYQEALNIQEITHNEKHPDMATTYGNIAEVYRIQGDYPHALEWYHKALLIHETLGKEHPKAVTIRNIVVKIYTERGTAYLNKKEYDRAIMELTEAINLNPANGEIYTTRAAAYYQKGDYDHAITGYTEATRLNPNYTAAYNQRGNVYYSKKEYDRAIEDYSLAIRLNPNNAVFYSNRGNTYRLRGDYDKAVADCTQAIKLEPNYAVSYNNRGVAYSCLQDRRKAIADFTNAVRLAPNNVVFKKNLASEEAQAAKERMGSSPALNDVKIAGVMHDQAEFDKFMIEYPQKLASEGYSELDRLGGKAGELYQEFAKLSIAINPGEIYEYTHIPYKLLVSRSDIGVMISYIKIEM